MYTHFSIISDFHTTVPVHFSLGDFFSHSTRLLTIWFGELIVGICLWFTFVNARFVIRIIDGGFIDPILDASKNAFGAIVDAPLLIYGYCRLPIINDK